MKQTNNVLKSKTQIGKQTILIVKEYEWKSRSCNSGGIESKKHWRECWNVEWNCSVRSSKYVNDNIEKVMVIMEI